jgi:hypothetical protein
MKRQPMAPIHGMLGNRKEENMKKLLYSAVIALTFFLSSTAFADYVIKLKNGRSVETERYWEEKDAIKFQYQGGVASLLKRNILSIVKVEGKLSERSSKQKEQPPALAIPVETKKTPAPEMAKATPAEASKEAEVKENDKKEIDVESYKKQKVYYTEQFEQAYQRYLEASSRRDQEAKKKAWEEFNNYGGKVVSMEEELRKKNNGIVPQWWKE